MLISRKNKIVIFFLAVLALFSAGHILAANSWYYTRLADTGTGRIEVGGYSTKEKCLTDLKTVHSSWEPSSDCYLAGNITVAGFSPTNGKYQDTITVNGTNFIDVEKVSIGTTNLDLGLSVIVDSSTKMRIEVPANATSGKITIQTKNHGSATSIGTFTVSSTPSDMRWWYKNKFDGTIDGPFNDKKSCEDSSFGKREGECFQRTITEVEQEKKVGVVVKTNTDYYPLAPLPGIGETCTDDGTGKTTCVKTTPTNCVVDPVTKQEKCSAGPGFAKYLNAMIKLFIGLCAVLAMIMIIFGGIQYMTSELISSKQEGKKKITQAIFGLLLALGAYAILYTINPDLLNIGLGNLQTVSITISSGDTSTGSDTSLCVPVSPPSPDNAKGTSMKAVMAKPAMPEYETALKNVSATKGKKYLATAQAAMEGFYPGSKSYKTNNPGNIGNTNDGKTKTFNTLADGINAQINKVVSGSGSYKIGGSYPCALGNEKYNGYLYQYLRIYSTAARTSNTYLNAIIGFFADKGVKITGKTTMSEIYNMN